MGQRLRGEDREGEKGREQDEDSNKREQTQKTGKSEHVVKFTKTYKALVSVLRTFVDDDFTYVSSNAVTVGSPTCSYNNYYKMIMFVTF